MPGQPDLGRSSVTLPSKAVSGTATDASAFLNPCLVTGVFFSAGTAGDNLQVADSTGRLAANITLRAVGSVFMPLKHPVPMNRLIAACSGTGPFSWVIFYAEGV